MRDDGAPSTAVADDPELTFIERVSLRIAAVAWITAGVAMIIAVTDDAPSSLAVRVGLAVLVGSVAAVALSVLTGRFRSLITIAS